MVRDCGYCITIIYSRTGSQTSSREAPTEGKSREEGGKSLSEEAGKDEENLLEHTECIATEVLRCSRGGIKKA